MDLCRVSEFMKDLRGREKLGEHCKRLQETKKVFEDLKRFKSFEGFGGCKTFQREDVSKWTEVGK